MHPPTDDTDEATKGNPLEPSIIFATISNCDEGLICMNINTNVAQAVTGYQDSIVRVWRLDENVDENREKKKVPFFGRNLKNYKYELNEVLPKPKEAFSSDYVRHQQQLLEQSQAATSSSSLDTPRRQRYPMIELKGHSGPIYSVDQNSSNRLILSSSADESIRLWDTSILQCVAKYSCNSISWDAKFNPILDYYFASANQDTTVTIYSTDRILPLRMLTGHISDVNCVAWHGNNTFLASGSDDRTIRLWDIRSAQCNRLLKGSNSPITSIQICPVGNLLAAGNELGKIYLYDLRSSRILSVLQGHDSCVNVVSFNPENNTLVSGGQDCSVRIWDLFPAFETSFISTPAYQINPPSFPSKDPSANDLHHSTSNISGLNALGQVQNSANSSVVGGINHQNQANNFENYITKVIKPKHSFYTKASPVYNVGYTKENLVYGGGPCSFVSAASKLSLSIVRTIYD
jgi:transcription initiation factor TFIID subunit 5